MGLHPITSVTPQFMYGILFPCPIPTGRSMVYQEKCPKSRYRSETMSVGTTIPTERPTQHQKLSLQEIAWAPCPCARLWCLCLLALGLNSAALSSISRFALELKSPTVHTTSVLPVKIAWTETLSFNQ